MATNARRLTGYLGDAVCYLGIALLLLTLLVSTGVVVGTATADTAENGPTNVSTTSNVTTVSPTVVDPAAPDPASDKLGWENGVWYNATLTIDESDGYNTSEMNAIVARTMARVERVRELEFDRTPPVRLIQPSQQQNETAARYSDVNATSRTGLNVQYEALLAINQSTDAIRSQQALFGGGVGGYYAPNSSAITIVSASEDRLVMREGTLAQELFHAQQDQYFDLSTNVSTIEERNARNGIVEGDANYVEYLYRQRCADGWGGTCLVPNGSSGSAQQPPENLSIAMAQIFLQPYNSGVAFVRERQQRTGWDAIDAVYDRPPESTEQTIHPEKYRSDSPTEVRVTDRSDDDWRPLRHNGSRINSTVGEAGLFVALWYPSYQTRGSASVIPLGAHFNLNASGGISRPVQYTYDHEATAGWDGDKLLPYIPADGNGTAIDEQTALGNGTGFVYETVWDSPDDAQQFAEAYRQLLSIRGAENVSGHRDTYRIPDGGFADAFYVTQSGTNVTIVNAPTVEDLSAVRAGAAPAVEDTGSANGTDGTATPAEDAGTATDTETPGESGPGFGLLAGLSALVALVLQVTLSGQRRR